MVIFYLKFLIFKRMVNLKFNDILYSTLIINILKVYFFLSSQVTSFGKAKYCDDIWRNSNYSTLSFREGNFLSSSGDKNRYEYVKKSKLLALIIYGFS